MLRERETGDVWEIMTHGTMTTLMRQRDGLRRTVLADWLTRDYVRV